MLPDHRVSGWQDRRGGGSSAVGINDGLAGLGRAGLVSILAASAGFGVLLATVPDGRERLSVDLWLVGVALWAGSALVRRALSAVPWRRDRFRPPVTISAATGSVSPPVPRGVVAAEQVIAASTDSARTYDHRLRARLRAVAEHRLRTERGIDLAAEPGRLTEAVGDVGWLIDDGPAARAPTADEIGRLLDRIERDPTTAHPDR